MRPTTIFLAEDDKDLRTMLARMLRSDGYDVVEAQDGTELLELLATATSSPLARPDVIITDLLMPGYSGVGVLGALRNTGWDVPVILITARRDAAVIESAMRLGASRVLHKPLDVADLRAAIVS